MIQTLAAYAEMDTVAPGSVAALRAIPSHHTRKVRGDETTFTVAEDVVRSVAAWKKSYPGAAALYDQLLVLHDPLVKNMARRMDAVAQECGQGQGSFMSTAYSTGKTALMVAIVTFDPARGAAFSTYAGRVIHSAMNHELIKLPRLLLSLDTTVQGDGKRIALIRDPRSEAPDASVEASETRQREQIVLKLAEWVLSPREREILERRSGRLISGPLPFLEIANRLGLPNRQNAYNTFHRVQKKDITQWSTLERRVSELRGVSALSADTLEVIAASIGLTRERVRQIETDATDKLQLLHQAIANPTPARPQVGHIALAIYYLMPASQRETLHEGQKPSYLKRLLKNPPDPMLLFFATGSLLPKIDAMGERMKDMPLSGRTLNTLLQLGYPLEDVRRELQLGSNAYTLAMAHTRDGTSEATKIRTANRFRIKNLADQYQDIPAECLLDVNDDKATQRRTAFKAMPNGWRMVLVEFYGYAATHPQVALKDLVTHIHQSDIPVSINTTRSYLTKSWAALGMPADPRLIISAAGKKRQATYYFFKGFKEKYDVLPEAFLREVSADNHTAIQKKFASLPPSARAAFTVYWQKVRALPGQRSFKETCRLVADELSLVGVTMTEKAVKQGLGSANVTLGLQTAISRRRQEMAARAKAVVTRFPTLPPGLDVPSDRRQEAAAVWEGKITGQCLSDLEKVRLAVYQQCRNNGDTTINAVAKSLRYNYQLPSSIEGLLESIIKARRKLGMPMLPAQARALTRQKLNRTFVQRFTDTPEYWQRWSQQLPEPVAETDLHERFSRMSAFRRILATAFANVKSARTPKKLLRRIHEEIQRIAPEQAEAFSASNIKREMKRVQSALKRPLVRTRPTTATEIK